MINKICIIGAGTMGSGIAQVAAQSGFFTLLYDVDLRMLEKAKSSIEASLLYLRDKKSYLKFKKEILNIFIF